MANFQIVTAKGHRYLRIVESFRDPVTRRPKRRVLGGTFRRAFGDRFSIRGSGGLPLALGDASMGADDALHATGLSQCVRR